MIFVLHYIAAIQILFTLVANYVQSNPLILCEPNNFDHDYAITAACTEAWASSSEAPLAFAQKRAQDPFSGATGTVGGQAPTSPFQRPGIHQPHQSRTNGEQCWTMEMQDLHENMQLNTSILWRMWDFLAPMLRSIFSASSSTDQVRSAQFNGAMPTTGRSRIGKIHTGMRLKSAIRNGRDLQGQERLPEESPHEKPTKKMQTRTKVQREKAKLRRQSRKR